jgi:hypothetical protein
VADRKKPARGPAEVVPALPASLGDAGPEAGTHHIQGLVEGVDVTSRKVEFMGEVYRVADNIGAISIWKFAAAAEAGFDSNEMRGMAAQYALLKSVIHPDEWVRFETDAIEKCATGADLDKVTGQAMQVVFARPTGSPPDSSNGRRRTSANSRESSSRTGTQPPPDMYSVDSLLGR